MLTSMFSSAGKDDINLIRKVKQMMIAPNLSSQDASIEGLAFASAQPHIKEEIVSDKKVIEKLVQRLESSQAKADSSNNTTITFGILTILDNLTRFLPTLSEEQKKLSQLKAYANAAPKSAEQSPLDSETAVTKRGSILLAETAMVPVLVRSYKHFSFSSIALILSILLSLSRNPANRGKLAQQGAAKLLLKFYTSIAGTKPEDQLSRYTASHALARILISVDPSLIFPSSR